MTFEDQLGANIFSSSVEKTFIDKLLAKGDVDSIREIIKKPKLTRSELLELLYLISSTESKLLNLGEWDRYILLKYFVWIEEFIKLVQLLFDYEDRLKLMQEKEGFILNKRTRQQFENVQSLFEHNAKFLIDLYFNIGRTSLSLGGTGFLEMLKNKYEIAYPQQQTQTLPQEKRPLLSFRSGK